MRCKLAIGALVPLFFLSPLRAEMAMDVAPGLAGALQAMRSQHPSLRGKLAEVASKSSIGDSARAQRYPSLSAQASAQNMGRYPVTLTARQPVWAFGRIDNAINYADADLSAEEADLLRLNRQLTDQTVAAYVKVQGVERRLAVAADNIAALDLLSQQIQRRQQGQLASQADVRLAQARLVQARAQQERFQGEWAVAKAELEQLAQMPVDVSMAVPDALTQLPSPEEMETLAQAASAEILVKEQRIALAEADVEREKSAPMPTVYLEANHYFEQPGYGNDNRLGVMFEGRLEGMGFAPAGRIAASSSRAQASREELAATRNEVRRVVRSLYANRQAQQALSHSQGLSVRELSEILMSYRRQYEAGQKAWLDVLNVLRELTEQRLQQVQAETDWLASSLRLATVIGVLDDPEAAMISATTMAGQKRQDDLISELIRRPSSRDDSSVPAETADFGAGAN